MWNRSSQQFKMKIYVEAGRVTVCLLLLLLGCKRFPDRLRLSLRCDREPQLSGIFRFPLDSDG